MKKDWSKLGLINVLEDTKMNKVIAILAIAIIVASFVPSFAQSKTTYASLELQGFRDDSTGARLVIAQKLKEAYGVELVDDNDPRRTRRIVVTGEAFYGNAYWVDDAEALAKVRVAQDNIARARVDIERKNQMQNVANQVAWSVPKLPNWVRRVIDSGAQYKGGVDRERDYQVIRYEEEFLNKLAQRYEHVPITVSIKIEWYDLKGIVVSERIGHLKVLFSRKYLDSSYDRSKTFAVVDDDVLNTWGVARNTIISDRDRDMRWLFPYAVDEALSDKGVVIGKNGR